LTQPFHYAFMQRAFVAALVVGLLCSTMGTYVILRKLSFIGDGIAHASFAGIVIAYLRGANFYIGAGIVAVLTALGIGFVHRRGRISLDTTIGVLFTGMFALGVYLMSQQRSYAVDLQSFLFGDILAVQSQDLWLICALSVAVAATVIVLYRGLLYTTFDPVVAQASGIHAALYEYALLVMLALTIVVALQAARRSLPFVLRARVERRDDRLVRDGALFCGARGEPAAPRYRASSVNGTVYSLPLPRN
jgi:ABC-type Mn2+/Zn2+ transport system permease subunit